MLVILLKILMMVPIVGLIYCFIDLFKIDNANKNQILIIDAIHNHNVEMINQHRFDEIIDFEVVEKYDNTINRFWDWGYTRIVPPEVFEKIKPYIER